MAYVVNYFSVQVLVYFLVNSLIIFENKSYIFYVVNFMGQLLQATGCPDIRLNIILDVSMRLFLDEVST